MTGRVRKSFIDLSGGRAHASVAEINVQTSSLERCEVSLVSTSIEVAFNGQEQGSVQEQAAARRRI